MSPNDFLKQLTPADWAVFIHALEDIFEAMDKAYQTTAKIHGFVCRGCEDNCCRSLFHHYTLLEYAYLSAGLKQLDGKTTAEVFKCARATSRLQAQGRNNMCPLNIDGACVLYGYRPMICRLHGIPHQLQSPAGHIISGPGCDDFVRQAGSSVTTPLDRTPLYGRMSALEKRLRQTLKADLKFKLTIAQMVELMGKEAE